MFGAFAPPAIWIFDGFVAPLDRRQCAGRGIPQVEQMSLSVG